MCGSGIRFAVLKYCGRVANCRSIGRCYGIYKFSFKFCYSTDQNISGRLSNKSGLVAYNNTDFKSIINSNTGIDYLKDVSSTHSQRSDVIQSTLKNHDYSKFVNNSKKSSIPYRLRSKRFLENFHPIPVAKVSPKVVTPEKEVDKPVSKSGLAQQISIYKEDQLLSNPGGDNFFLKRQERLLTTHLIILLLPTV